MLVGPGLAQMAAKAASTAYGRSQRLASGVSAGASEAFAGRSEYVKDPFIAGGAMKGSFTYLAADPARGARDL